MTFSLHCGGLEAEDRPDEGGRALWVHTALFCAGLKMGKNLAGYKGHDFHPFLPALEIKQNTVFADRFLLRSKKVLIPSGGFSFELFLPWRF